MREHEGERVNTVGEVCRKLKKNKASFRIVYSWNGEIDPELDFDLVCKAVNACKQMTLVIEEVSLYCSPSRIPTTLSKIVGQGRHSNLGIICTSQTPKQINPFLRSQAGRIISFSQTEPGHIEWCKAVMGAEAEKLPKLKPFECLDWSPELCIVRDRNFDPV